MAGIIDLPIGELRLNDRVDRRHLEATPPFFSPMLEQTTDESMLLGAVRYRVMSPGPAHLEREVRVPEGGARRPHRPACDLVGSTRPIDWTKRLPKVATASRPARAPTPTDWQSARRFYEQIEVPRLDVRNYRFEDAPLDKANCIWTDKTSFLFDGRGERWFVKWVHETSFDEREAKFLSLLNALGAGPTLLGILDDDAHVGVAMTYAEGTLIRGVASVATNASRINARTLKDIQTFSALCAAHRIFLGDFQFILGADGSATPIDFGGYRFVDPEYNEYRDCEEIEASETFVALHRAVYDHVRSAADGRA